jgi:GntR family transcriptional regulator
MDTRYARVHAHLRNRIVSGEMQPGDRVPGERAYAAMLGVSRETVRQGFRLAEEEGFIVRIPGRGTFVAERRIRQDLGRMQAFDLTVRGANLVPTYELVSVGQVRADAVEAGTLGVAPGDPILAVEAIGMGDRRPLAHYRSLIPASVATRLPPAPDWRSAASYQVIGRALDLMAMSVRQRWEARPVPPDIAALLQVGSGASAFRSTSVFTDDAGTQLESRVAWYPGSRYEFTINRAIDLTG